MEIKCELKSKEQMRSGIGKNQKPWSMMKFTVLQKGFNKPTELDITAFNDNAMFINDTSVGTELVIDGFVVSETKEYVKDGQQKSWRSTDFKMQKVEVLRENGYQQAPPPPPTGEADELPF